MELYHSLGDTGVILDNNYDIYECFQCKIPFFRSASILLPLRPLSRIGW